LVDQTTYGITDLMGQNKITVYEGV